MSTYFMNYALSFFDEKVLKAAEMYWQISEVNE